MGEVNKLSHNASLTAARLVKLAYAGDKGALKQLVTQSKTNPTFDKYVRLLVSLIKKNELQEATENNRRKEIKKRVAELLSNADIKSAVSLYESDCKEWWDKTSFSYEKAKVENFLFLETRRNGIKTKVIELLSNAKFEDAFRLYDSDCKDWWSEIDFADEKEKSEKRLYQSRILKWCREHHFVSDEIIGLIDINKQRSHNFADFLLKNQQFKGTIIPHSKLKWAAINGATTTVSRYVKSCIFQAGSSLLFEVSSDCHVDYSNKLNRASLHEYLRVDNRTVRNDDTRRIWNFKNGGLNEVQHYVNLLDAVIAPNVIVCCAPSSGRDDWGPGLLRTAEILGERQNRRSHPKLLRRLEDTVPRSRGGDRSKELNLRTIEVTDKTVIKEKPIVIIDDVTTSGQTLTACSELLWNAGCNCVGAIALGLTTNINSEQMASRNLEPVSDLEDEIPF